MRTDLTFRILDDIQINCFCWFDFMMLDCYGHLNQAMLIIPIPILPLRHLDCCTTTHFAYSPSRYWVPSSGKQTPILTSLVAVWNWTRCLWFANSPNSDHSANGTIWRNPVTLARHWFAYSWISWHLNMLYAEWNRPRPNWQSDIMCVSTRCT